MNTTPAASTHSILFAYLLWIFGFTGSHRFYYGRPLTGILWFCTLGLLGIGWLVDLFLIPSMDRQADRRFTEGHFDYNITWLLLTFLGLFGVHRMYLGKWFSGLIFAVLSGLAALTGGFLFFLAIPCVIGLAYDFCTLNSQIS
ncbi:MAG TPA: TM2 domain-containing protein, partial [Prosthecobacter sp.]|nr:TM2 domain-containing protein [Prosthecobacter sp.]